MTKPDLFNSFSESIPPIRKDLEIIPVEDNGQELLYFHDILGYSGPGFALDRKAEPILSFLTGRESIDNISKIFGESLTREQILDFVQMLDEQQLLESDHFRKIKNNLEQNFENRKLREPALSGESYPAKRKEFNTFMDGMVTGNFDTKTGANPPIKALYAPHIDLKVGGSKYSEAFSLLKELRPSRVVILATSHYAGLYGDFYTRSPFIGSVKDYQLPNRVIETDVESIRELSSHPDNGFTIKDRAHRIEHSIELHLLFASSVWKHPFKIVPILVSGFDELFYHPKSDLSRMIDLFSKQLRELDDHDTFFLISGDLSHVGKKFGDNMPASDLRNEVEKSDTAFLDFAKKGNAGGMIHHLKQDFDSTRICGFPPLLTFLKTFPDIQGQLINYSWWDESERESAVSFGSISY